MVEQETNYDIDIVSRLRFLERKQESLREKVLLINNNLVEMYKDTLEDIKYLQKSVQDIKDDIALVKDTVKDIVEEIDNFASKDQIKSVEKYVKIWDPLNFVTRQEVEDLLKKHKKNG